MTQKWKLAIAVIICLVGVGLGVRSLWRPAPAPDEAAEASAELEAIRAAAAARLERTSSGLQTVTRQDAPHVLDDATRSLSKKAKPEVVRSDRAADLRDAFRARLAVLMTHEPRESLADLERRGWPETTPDQLESYEERWARRLEDELKLKIDPASVEIIRLDPEFVTTPTRDESLRGFGRSCSQAYPMDQDNHPMKGLVEPDEGVVEVRLRGAVTDINGRLCDAFIGYRFTWDRNLECWRWVQTCLYTKDEDGPFAGQPVI